MTRPQEDRDFELWRETGDPAAIARVFDRVAPKLLLVASHWARPGIDAEDLLQTTFLQALRDRSQWNPRQRLLPWLASILVHRAQDSRRRARLREHEELPADAISAREPAPPDRAIEAELLEQITAAVEALPSRYREVLVLKLVHGLGATEIAHALGRSPVTVRKQLERGLERLRRALPAGIAVPTALVLSGTALAAARARVLSEASTLVPLAPAATSALAATATAASTKKLAFTALALVALATLGVGLWAGGASQGSLAPGEPHVDPMRVGIAEAASPDVDVRAARESVVPDVPPLAPNLGALHARVIWARDGSPAANIGMFVLVRERANWLKHPVLGRTDAQGNFHCTGLEPGTVHIETDRSDGIEAEVQAGACTEIVVAIPHGINVNVLVVDPEGAPVPGAGIWLSDNHRSAKGAIVAEADEQGRCRLQDVGPGRHVAARARGFAGSSVHSLRQGPGVETSIVLRLREAGGSVFGRVLDVDGAPIRSARVHITPRALPQERDEVTGDVLMYAPPFELTSDRDGMFEAHGLATGRATVLASARGYGNATAEVDVGTQQPHECVLELPAACRIRGRVLDERGMFVPQALVSIEGIHALDTGSDAAGAFELVEVTAGSIKLRCSKQGMRPVHQSLELRAGALAEIELRLRPGERKPEIRGRLVDEAGQAIAGWWITAAPLDPSKRWRAHAESDAKGEFILQLTEALPCRVQAGSERYQFMPAVWVDGVSADEDPIELRLPAGWRPASLHARVTDGRGAPIAAAHVSLMHWEFGVGRGASTDADGSFAIDLLTTMGEYRLQVRAAGHPWHERVLQVEPGRRLDLGTVVLPQSGGLVARLPDLENRSTPIDWHDCKVSGPDGTESGCLVHEADTLRCAHLAPGRHVLQLRGGPHALTAVPFDIVSGRETLLDVTLRPGIRRRLALELPPELVPSRSILITILDANDLPLWNERNIVFPGDPRPIHIGPVLANGSYTIRAESRGRTARATLLVTEVGQPTLPPLQTLTLR